MTAKRQLTIGQLARTMQIAASTIRYYERIGLLLPDERSGGNYRLYTETSLRRLRFIRAAQSVGFTLDDIQTLLGAQNGTEPSCREVQARLNSDWPRSRRGCAIFNTSAGYSSRHYGSAGQTNGPSAATRSIR